MYPIGKIPIVPLSVKAQSPDCIAIGSKNGNYRAAVSKLGRSFYLPLGIEFESSCMAELNPVGKSVNSDIKLFVGIICGSIHKLDFSNCACCNCLAQHCGKHNLGVSGLALGHIAYNPVRS